METPSVTPLKNSATTETQKTEDSPKTIMQTPKLKIAPNNLSPRQRGHVGATLELTYSNQFTYTSLVVVFIE